MTNLEKLQTYVKEQTGIVLEPCDYFSGEQTMGNEIYYNFILKNRVWDSQEFFSLNRLAQNSSLISRIEPNGVERIAIILK